MGHLHTVAAQSEKNLMPILNLAPLWGPNITTVEEHEAKVGQVYGQTSGEMESFHAVSPEDFNSFEDIKKFKFTSIFEMTCLFRWGELALRCALTSWPTTPPSSMWTERR